MYSSYSHCVHEEVGASRNYKTYQGLIEWLCDTLILCDILCLPFILFQIFACVSVDAANFGSAKCWPVLLTCVVPSERAPYKLLEDLQVKLPSPFSLIFEQPDQQLVVW